MTIPLISIPSVGGGIGGSTDGNRRCVVTSGCASKVASTVSAPGAGMTSDSRMTYTKVTTAITPNTTTTETMTTETMATDTASARTMATDTASTNTASTPCVFSRR